MHFAKIILITPLLAAGLCGQQPTPVPAAAKPAARPAPPQRDPNSPGYVKAKELPDGAVPSPTENGNFIIGATHSPAAELAGTGDVQHGKVFEFTMDSKDRLRGT